MTMQDDLLELARIKTRMGVLAEAKAEVEERLVKALNAKGQKTLSATVGGAKVNGTLVAPQRVTVDEERLKTKVDTPTWKKITRLVLDKDKLEAAVAMNVVDAAVVAQCSDIKDTKPYVKMSGDVTQAGNIPAPTKRAVKAPRKR